VAGQRLRRTAWRSIKHEEFYLHAQDSIGQAKTGHVTYQLLQHRAGASMDKQTPDELYFATLPAIKRAP
jgi:putative transposase